jgi:hypothetical protein
MKKNVIKPRTPEGVKYKFASKESFLVTLSKATPKELKPTKKTGYAFGGIFLIVVVIALLKFPIGEMMAGNANVSLEVGIPKTFLEFDLMDPAGAPAKIDGLIIDLLIYIFIAYAIDVIINLVINNRLLESKEERAKRPQIFKDKNQPKTIAEKVTKKVLGKQS